jgi:hypothetical protein
MFDFTLLVIPGAALVRNVAGWFENSMKDGSVSSYEWGQLGSTVLRFCVISAGFVLGLNLDPAMAAGATVLADIGISTVKKIGTQ